MILNGMNAPRPFIKNKGSMVLQMSNSTLKEKLIERLGDLKFSELNNLVIEGVICTELSPEDKEFIELFSHIELLAFNDNKLRVLQNLPNI